MKRRASTFVTNLLLGCLLVGSIRRWTRPTDATLATLTEEQRSTLAKLHFRPVILIPGFASSRLRVWRQTSCPYGPDFNLGDAVWLSTSRVLVSQNCWLECIGNLDPMNQTDGDRGCAVRPDEGLDSISELDPGYITGPLSNVWKSLVHMFVDLGYMPGRHIFAVPYDWRLPGATLQGRDGYFSFLKQTIEFAVSRYRQRGEATLPVDFYSGPAIVITHSHGSNVFRYFLEWLKTELGTNHHQEWIDSHIGTFIAVGAPLLGAVESMKAAMTGVTFGLPVRESSMRMTSSHFGSQAWMMPFIPSTPSRLHQQVGNAVSYPVNYLDVDLPDAPNEENTPDLNRPSEQPPLTCAPGDSNYPQSLELCSLVDPDGTVRKVPCAQSDNPVDGTSDTPPTLPKNGGFHPPQADADSRNDATNTRTAEDPFEDAEHCASPSPPPRSVPRSTSRRRHYHSNDVASGVFFDEMGLRDPIISRIGKQYRKFYRDDPILNPLTPWERPPIKSVICAYGINRRTPIGYRYEENNDGFLLADTIFEEGQNVISYSGEPVMPVSYSNPNLKRVSGDGTVPYYSLSWAHTWLGDGPVNITRIPQATFASSQVKVCLDCNNADWHANHTGAGHTTFFQTAVYDHNRHCLRETQVWEFDNSEHRETISAAAFVHELQVTVLERAGHASLLSERHKDHQFEQRQPLRASIARAFSASVAPMSDTDCYWDYFRVMCAWPEFCEYRYNFGDVHLSQSCRLRQRPEETK